MQKNIVEAYLQLGQKFEKTAQWAKAVENYSQAIQVNPDFAPAYYYRGLLRSKLGDEQKSANDLIQALKIDPRINGYCKINENDYINGVSSSCLLDSYDDQAVEEYIQVLQIQSLGANDYYKRGIVRSELGDVRGAFKDLNTSIQLNPELVEAYFERGRIFYEINNFSKIINANNTQSVLSDYNQAISLNPNLADAYYNRGVIRIFDARNRVFDVPPPDVKGGIEDFNEAIRLNPNHAEAYFARSIAYYIQLEVEEQRSNSASALSEQQKLLLPGVLKDAIQALRLDPDVTKLVQQECRSLKLIKFGNKQRGVEKFTRRIQTDSNNINAYCHRGWASLKVGKQQGAVEDFTWVIEHNSQDAKAYCGRGFVYYQLKNYQQAIEDYSQAIKLKSDFVEAYLLRSLVRYDSGDKQGARQDTTEAIQWSGGTSGKAFLFQSQIRYELGNKLGAWNDFVKATKEIKVYFLDSRKDAVQDEEDSGRGGSAVEGKNLDQRHSSLQKRGK
jgi:tetratricopeptide (TPR) repeat protein